MKMLKVLIICLLGVALAQTTLRSEDINTTVTVKKLEQGKLQDVTLVKKGQVLVYLVQVTIHQDFPAGRLGLKLVAPQGAMLLPERTQVKGYKFRIEYSQDGKTFQKTLKTWKYLRVVVLNGVPAGKTLEVRLYSRVK
ncbi:hypothetical protein [Deinococcus roseus]|uniref:Uncharacterized protein n=1 Tax=Deinococcus roseus TaxID=392414 RepID=A0ABQ2CYX1_9DEIO|nr:hypothetical protein [Deinococcus roseus]GGJ23413.1 hypothetical protein GCM10008938_06960 [Deinococcus roseus]